jgi:hypothetical protein
MEALHKAQSASETNPRTREGRKVWGALYTPRKLEHEMKSESRAGGVAGKLRIDGSGHGLATQEVGEEATIVVV